MRDDSCTHIDAHKDCVRLLLHQLCQISCIVCDDRCAILCTPQLGLWNVGSVGQNRKPVHLLAPNIELGCNTDGEANGGAVTGPMPANGLKVAQTKFRVQITKDWLKERVDEPQLALIQLLSTGYLV